MIEINSIEEVSEQIVQDIESKTNQTTPAVPFAFNKNLADAVAAQSAVTKLHNVDQRKECFVETASEFVGLPKLAFEANTPRIKGYQAILEAQVYGVDGTIIGSYSAGPEFVGGDVIYETISGGIISGGIATISIRAKIYGEDGNLQNGSEVTLSSTYPNINDTALITATLTTGGGRESVESWRQRISQEKAFPSTVAGTTPWFAKIAKKVPGITGVWPYSSDTIGSVDLYLSADNEIGGVPTVAQFTAVEDTFKLAPNDCLWSTLPDRINTIASTKENYSVEITEGATSISAKTRSEITTEIEKYFETRAPYIEGLSLQNTAIVSKSDVIAVAQNVIQGSTGETGVIADIVITKSGDPAADIYPMPKGLRATVTAVTFV
jgi:hypothetical protein